MDNQIALYNQIFDHMEIELKNVGHTLCDQSWYSQNSYFEYDSIGFVLDGSIWIRYNDTEFVAQSGELYYIPGGNIQSFHTHQCHTATKYWCHFSAQLSGSRLYDFIHIPNHVTCSSVDMYANLFQTMLKAYRVDAIGNSLLYQSKLLELIHGYINHHSNQLSLKNNQLTNDMHHIIAYIEKNISNPLSIKELADIAGFSTNYFIELFKRYFHITPHQYIINQKMSMAKTLLTCTDLTVKEISTQLGFSSQNYFSEIFKNHTSYSPSLYRKLQLT